VISKILAFLLFVHESDISNWLRKTVDARHDYLQTCLELKGRSRDVF